MANCNNNCTTNCCKVRRNGSLVTLGKHCGTARSGVLFKWSTAGDAYKNTTRKNCGKGPNARFSMMW